jgi:hypothetical protein
MPKTRSSTTVIRKCKEIVLSKTRDGKKKLILK